MKEDVTLYTTPFVDGFVIEKYLGMVVANQVAGTGFFSDLTASISDVFGGHSGTYRNHMDNLYNDVKRQLIEQAQKMGANAIIGVGTDYGNIPAKGMSMFMFSMHGTAVRLVEDKLSSRYNIYKKLHDLHVYMTEGLLSQEEYDREVKLVKELNCNAVEEKTLEIEAENRKKEEAIILMQKKEEALQKIMGAEKKSDDELKTLLSDDKKLYGFIIGDAVVIKGSEDVSVIEGFTPDKKMVCKVGDQYRIFNFGEFRLV